MPTNKKNNEKVKPQINPDEIKPTNPIEYARRGWAYYFLHDYSAAGESFLEALRSNPDDIDFQYGLALTYKNQGKTTEALRSLENILRMIDSIEDRDRATMLKRLTFGHINRITQGDWNLGELVWKIKS